MRVFKSKNCFILIVDDYSENIHRLESILEQAGYATAFALNKKQALELISKTKPDLILLNLFMPDLKGLEVCQILKADPAYQDIPIIFLNSSLENSDLLKTFELGATDYISTPLNDLELLTRVRIYLELKRPLEEFKQLVTTDPLTGIPNRQYLLTLAEEEINRSHYYTYSLSIFIMDIDDFKNINDFYGYNIGDTILQMLSQIITNAIRKDDYFGRFGGDKFLGVLPHTSTRFALEVAQRLRQKINHSPFTIQDQQLQIAVSMGVATYQPDDQNIDQLLKRANEALVEAKNRGRNRVIVHQNDVVNLPSH